ncbi:MAG: peptide ABC transporter substrate-binding protein [Anaerolineales bacterium]|nr:peptide ABC transporter substrate-binding protein [Anaerolineales bacterium]
MKRLRWQLLIVFLALIAIALLLIGQQPVISPPAIAPQPIEGGTYTEGLIGSFLRLNPLLDNSNLPDRDVDRLIFSSLVRYDDRGLPQGDLAESWGISQDAKIYNFSLRKDVFWHDGEPLTAKDVLFTIELLRDPDMPVPEDLRNLWKDVDVKTFNEYTIQFKLPEAFAPFLDYLTFGILPEHILGGLSAQEIIDDPFNAHPIGSGPYKFSQWVTQGTTVEGVSLVANDDYYQGRPFIDKVLFRYYPDQEVMFNAYEDGEILAISRVGDEIFDQALQEPSLNFYTSRLPQISFLLLNLDSPKVPFFQNTNIRKALLKGLNRQKIIDRIYHGQATIADGPVFPNTWAYYEGIQRIGYNSEEAIDMLKEEGYTIPAEGGAVRVSEDGTKLVFSLVYPDDENHRAIANEIKKYWNAIGVSVNLTPVPYDQLITEYLEPRLYQAALVDLDLADSPDPDPYPFWHQTQATGGQNYSLWNDRQASEYLEQARIIVDPKERARLYRNFQVRFVNELPALPLFYPMYTYAVDQQVQGVRIGPLFEPSDRFETITKWYFFSEKVLQVKDTESP